MKFLSIYKTAERSAPPSQEEMARIGKLVEDGMKAGFLLATRRVPAKRAWRAHSHVQREAHRDRRAICRSQRSSRRLRAPSGELKGGSSRDGQEFPTSSRGW
jgi:hypothetical protein